MWWSSPGESAGTLTSSSSAYAETTPLNASATAKTASSTSKSTSKTGQAWESSMNSQNFVGFISNLNSYPDRYLSFSYSCLTWMNAADMLKVFLKEIYSSIETY